MPTRMPLSAPPHGALDDLPMQRRPDPAAMRAGAMWREAARHFAAVHPGSRPFCARQERALRALAVVWDAAAATAYGRDGRRCSPTIHGPRTRLTGRAGGRHLSRLERRSLMSAAAAAYRELCGVDYSDRTVMVSAPRQPGRCFAFPMLLIQHM